MTPSHRFPAFLRRTALVSVSTLLITNLSTAAIAVQVPTSVDAGQVQKRLQSEPVQALPQSNVQAPAPAPQLPKNVQEQLAKQRFTLKKVSIEGSTVFTPADLKFAYDGMLGKQISMLDANTIASRITKLYHDRGYILSQATLPKQSVADGVLKIRVIEGYISNVVIQGDTRGSNRQLLQSYGKHITSQRPISIYDMERYLLLFNDLPGANAKGVVRPSKTSGAADLVITMTHKTFDASYTFDNRGTRFVGPLQHSFTAVANSIFGLYDRTMLRAITVSPIHELHFFELQHEEQVDSEGTRLILDASYGLTRPGDTLKPLKIESESIFYQAKLVHPFIRSRQENLNGRLIADMRDTDTDFGNLNLTEDRLRVVRLGGSYDFADKWVGVNLIDAQVSQGLDIFNASRKVDQVSNSDADGTFTKINLDLSRTQPLPHEFSLFAAASGQYAFDPLLSAEQFTLGGVGFGQAYDPAELAGDHGVGAKVELRYGQTINDTFVHSYQFYGFYDIGHVWIRDGGVGANDNKSLASMGLGVRTNFTQHVSGYLEIAQPLTKGENNVRRENEPRLFFSITGRF